MGTRPVMSCGKGANFFCESAKNSNVSTYVHLYMYISSPIVFQQSDAALEL